VAWERAEHPHGEVAQRVLPEIESWTRSETALGDLLPLWSAPRETLPQRAGRELSRGLCAPS